MKKKFIPGKFVFIAICTFFLSLNLSAQTEDLKVGTATRKMLVYAPSTIQKNRPLLISMHGLNQDIAYQQNQTKWETVADANNFVVVYPAGINNSWDLYGTSDTDFILAIIEEMYKRYSIDRDRVYLSGFSMGGMMTYHAANIIADKIAAFAPVSGYLMGGPDTVSKRPIPIIHTHGTSDDVVPFSGVQTCLNAWIKRDGCPTTAQVTKPYPSNKPLSNATKYYWGLGKDQVSVVLLRIEGVGHWHSINPDGVNTSEEIWNFCKNYALGFGVPKFVSAFVTDDSPRQIKLELSKSIADSIHFSGFTVNIDNQPVSVDSIVLADSSHLIINLADTIHKTDDISLSYSNGNVFSVYNKALAGFSNTRVENLLKGASPRLIDASTNTGGDTLLVKFNMKMQFPADSSAFTLNTRYNNSDIVIPVLRDTHFNYDSTQLVFTLNQKVYADYNLVLSYSGNNIASSDSGLLKVFSDFPVTNNAIGLPVHVVSGKTEADGITITLSFSKPMVISSAQMKYFSVKVNGSVKSIKSCSASENTVKLILSNNMHFGDTAVVTYTPGDVKAADKGLLESFNNLLLQNAMSVPVWLSIPGKIEAEKYTLQSGTQTEQTGDTGGGLNVGWIDTGDWLDYAIENTSTNTLFDVTFRLASINTGCKMDCYIDNNKLGSINVPNTGNWQTYQSVNGSLNITPGKHYLKLVASVGGFNINYFNLQLKPNGIKELTNADVKIYPNPASNKIFIHAGNFVCQKIEILDLAGNSVLIDSKPNYPETILPVNLKDGLYIIKLSNENQYHLEKIVIQNDR